MIFLALAALSILACLAGSLPPSTPTDDSPIEILTVAPSPMRTATPISTPTLLSFISTSMPFPTWVAEFSDPILKALAGQKPDFQDDFQGACILEFQWKVCSTPEQRPYYQEPFVSITARPTLDLQPDLQNGYSLLNQGWFYIVPDSARNPFYAHIQAGALLLKLPEGKEKKDLMVYNPYLRYKNFVLSLELQFDETQPPNAIRFQFNQSAEQSVALDLFKNKNWAFHWGLQGKDISHTGVYNYFPPVRILILIIARGAECAVYLNNAPLDYVSDCRSDAIVQASPQAVAFHILADPGHSAIAIIDNVKMWDLDKIQGLP